MSQDYEGNLGYRVVELRPRANKSGQASERNCFKRLMYLFLPLLKKTEILVAQYLEGKAVKPSAENIKLLKEALAIAEKKELIQSEVKFKAQKTIRVFCANVDDIFKKNGLPEQAKRLKFEKLRQENPEVFEQLDKPCILWENLALKCGVRIKLIEDK